MPFGERAAGTGFQVPFKSHGAFISLKTDNRDKTPRAIFCRVSGTPGIMLTQSSIRIRG
jgi:hypothetical protein